MRRVGFTFIFALGACVALGTVLLRDEAYQAARAELAAQHAHLWAPAEGAALISSNPVN